MTRLRPAGEKDAAAIAAIYAPFVTETAITFETEPPSAAEMAKRMASSAGLYPWLIAEEPDGVAGYAYAAQFNARQAYRFSVHTTIYLRPEHQGRGLGRRLYQRLLEGLAAQGFAQAIALITLPNEPSVGLHERLGFARTGLLSRIGYKLGVWHDVGIWQARLAEPGEPPQEPVP